MPKWLSNIGLLFWQSPQPQVWEPQTKRDTGLGIQVNVPLPLLSNPAQSTGVCMNLSKILTAFQLVGAVVGPLVAFADTVAPNSKGVQKLDAVVNGVKGVVATGSDVVTLAEEEWAVIKPAVESLVSAFADVKHALEAPKTATPATTPAG